MGRINTFLFVNGKLSPSTAPVIRGDDPGFLLGDGAFETMRIRGGRLVLWPRHHARLAHTLDQLGIRGAGLERVPDEVAALVRHNSIDAGRARVTVSRGLERPSRLVMVVAETARLRARRRGVELWSVAATRALPALKGIGRLAEVLAARAVAHRSASPEALFVDAAGDALETATANVFAWGPDGLWTPPTDGRVLPGISRGLVLEAAGRLGLPVREAPLPRAALRAGFVSNALLPLAPVLAVDGEAVDAPPPAWGELLEVFDALTLA